MPLALVINLTGIVPLTSSVSIELVSSSARVTSVKSAKGPKGPKFDKGFNFVLRKHFSYKRPFTI